jgi:ribosomal protein L4
VLFLAESYWAPDKNKKEMSRPAHRYENFLKSIRNIQKVEFLFVPNINGYDLMVSQDVVILEPAIDEFMMTLGGKK